MLLHCLSCGDRDVLLMLLAKAHVVIVSFFWDCLHWVLQSVLFLPIGERGHGLIRLASKGAVFQHQFIQRLKTLQRLKVVLFLLSSGYWDSRNLCY